MLPTLIGLWGELHAMATKPSCHDEGGATDVDAAMLSAVKGDHGAIVWLGTSGVNDAKIRAI